MKQDEKVARSSERGEEEERIKTMNPTVQAHIVEGEDGRPAGGPGAMEGHMQDTVRGLDTMFLQRDVFGGESKFRLLH